MILDPTTIEYCPCSRPIQQGKDYFVCRPCWITAPEFFRIKLNSKSQLRRDQARNQILLHAQRRARL